MKDSFKNRLSQALIYNNMIPADLMRKTGIGKSLISGYLNGKYEAKQKKLTILAEALNVNEAWLMGYDVPMKNKNILDIAKSNLEDTLSNYKKMPIKALKFYIKQYKDNVYDMNKIDKLIEEDKFFGNICNDIEFIILEYCNLNWLKDEDELTNEVIERILKDTNSNITYSTLLSILNNLDYSKISSNLFVNSRKYYNCPVYGQISAGEPNWAEENLEGYLPIDPELMGIINPEEHYFLKVNGESMNKIVKNGAFALIHKQDAVENGEIAVVLVNGDNATLKRFSKKGNVIVLTPESTDETIKQQIYTKESDVKVIGKYIGKMEFNK